MLIKTKKLAKKQTGQSLIELLIAMVIFIMVIASITFMTLDAQVADRQGEERTRATQLAYEGLDASKSIKNRGWKYLTIGQHGLDSTNGFWEFAGSENIIDQFKRQVIVANVYRDNNKNIVETGGTIDFDTKKITSNVNWSFTPERPSDVTLASYLTNWKSKKWLQTTQAHFDAGTKNGVLTVPIDDGALQLNTASSTSSKIWEFDQATDYSYESSKIEVTSSVAKLKQITGPKSGDTLNPDFKTNADSWTFSSWGAAGATGNYKSTGGNPDGYVDINIPKTAGTRLGGYWYQGFDVAVNNPTVASLNFDWRAINLTYANLVFPVTLYVFVDSASGPPTIGTEVWSQSVEDITAWTGPVTLDVKSKLASAGRYYLKLAFWVVTPPKKPAGPFTIGYDNAKVHWEGFGTSYPTDEPTINPINSFTAANITQWTSFTEVASGTTRYQLSNDGGKTWRYWNGSTSTWEVAGPGQYNDAATVNGNINRLGITAFGINFKTFLISNGQNQVTLDSVTIGYSQSSFTLSGDFVSSVFDSGSDTTNYNYIAWTADVPTGSTLKFQIRTTGRKQSFPPNWLGPDGTSNTYFENPGDVFPDPDLDSTYRIQYKAYFTSNGQNTPVLKDITIDYEQ